MKKIDSLLTNVFSLSRLAPDVIPSELPFGLETAVLAHWRSARQAPTNGGTLRGLRWGACVACAVALLSAALERAELAEFARRSDLQTRIADSAIAAGFNYE